MTNTFPEREPARKLQEANRIPAAPATVAVKEMLAGIDVEGGAGLSMQGTESGELLLSAGRASPPVEPTQVIQKRKLLFELFEILAGRARHTVFHSQDQHKSGRQGDSRQGWWVSRFRGFRGAAARALAGKEPWCARTTATRGGRESLPEPAIDSRLRASYGGTKMTARNPNWQTSGAVWRAPPPGPDL